MMPAGSLRVNVLTAVQMPQHLKHA